MGILILIKVFFVCVLTDHATEDITDFFLFTCLLFSTVLVICVIQDINKLLHIFKKHWYMQGENYTTAARSYNILVGYETLGNLYPLICGLNSNSNALSCSYWVVVLLRFGQWNHNKSTKLQPCFKPLYRYLHSWSLSTPYTLSSMKL